MPDLYRLLRSALFRLDAETAHELALHWLALLGRTPMLLRILFGPPTYAPRRVWDLDFPNPIGLAAGMDKNAVALPAWEALGFGFIEAGTITAHAQPGNPRPRLFRYPQLGALVNRMGFNNQGAEAVARRLEKAVAQSPRRRIPLGLNIGKSKVTPLEEAPQDYLASYRRLYDLGDYFVINVSSPNTPGLRSLQAADELARILDMLRSWEGARRKPLLVKLAPDLEESALREAAQLAESRGADGLIATNTTLDHSSLPAGRDQTGGLSGTPLRARAARVLRLLRKESQLPLVASGGVMTADDARERFHDGAALVQVYTGFVYRGPRLLREICQVAPKAN